MSLDKPIILLGTGRSGSTAIHQALALHPQVAWLSRLGDRFPANMSIHHFIMKALDWPAIGNLVYSAFGPSESYRTWEYYCPGFRRPFRDLTPDDLTLRSKKRVQTAMSDVLTPKRSRLMLKVTGWPRIGFLREIFENAKFIHILRDGRAVVNSMISVDFWRGWEGPNNWRWGELTEQQRTLWEKYDKSFLVLAAINWQIILDAIEESKRYINEKQYLEVKYEDICENPLNEYRRIIDFCELSWQPQFEASLRRFPFRNTNEKYRNELTEAQQKILNDVLRDYLQRHGYED